MSTATIPSEPISPADLAAEDAAYFRTLLHELIDMGMGVARVVHKQVTAPADAAPAGDEASTEAGDSPAAPSLPALAVAFDRISRCVRRTVALARKLAEPVPTKVEASPEHKRIAARRRILREVEDAIQREAEGADVDALEAELRERLDGPEMDDEIGDRPIAEIITDICRDLGLLTLLGNHPWKRRMPQDVAALCERAARPPGAASAEPPPPPLPEVGGRFRTWAGPPAYNREASIELMHKLLEHKLPKRSRRGPAAGGGAVI